MRLITLAIHTFPHASTLRRKLEREGIAVTLQNVDLDDPRTAPGVRVRIAEHDLPRALRIVENPEIFSDDRREAEGSFRRSFNVILPIDFSESSLKAVGPAFRLAALHSGRVTLVYAVAPEPLFDSSTLDDALTFDSETSQDLLEEGLVEAMAEKRMKRFCDRLRDRIKGGEVDAVAFDTVITTGLPEEVINETAKAKATSLIVMATRGADRKQRELIGSVTAEVLDTCRYTVLTVPDAADFEVGRKELKVLFFAIPDQQDIVALDALRSLIPDVEIDLTLANIPQRRRPMTDTSSLDRLADYCRANYKGFSVETSLVNADNVVDEVDRLNAQKGFDLICVPNRKKNIVARFFSPTLAHRVLFHADVPLLGIPV